MILLWLAQVALAGQVYINGTLVNPAQISGTTLEKVDVVFDAQGNVRVSAPGYKIEVMDPAAGGVGAPPAAGAVPPPPGAPQPAAYPPSAYPPPATAAATAGAYPPAASQPAAAAGMHPSGVAKATWWLVTEDNGSVGHTVEVFVNGKLVETVRSGDAVRIVDVGAHLRPGTNQVQMKSVSQNASGGTMYVYIGSGDDKSGTVVMPEPEVQFGLGSSRKGPYQRDYTVQVP